MRVGLSTGTGAMRIESVLSELTFFRPYDCTILVLSLQAMGNVHVLLADTLSWV
jgi:hypothetical protein